MFRNLGRYDRLARVLVGMLLILLAFVGPQSAWGLVGLVPLITGLFGYCPIYTLLGISTCDPALEQKNEARGRRLGLR